MTNQEELLKRITINAEIFSGKPIIRGKRLAVEHVLSMLATGDDSAPTLLENIIFWSLRIFRPAFYMPLGQWRMSGSILISSRRHEVFARLQR